VKRFLLTLVVAAALSAWCGAEDDSARRPSPVEQAQLLHRNRALLVALVEGGIDLTRDDSDSALVKADHCQRMAVKLKDEIRGAVGDGEAVRTLELTRHLIKLVEFALLPNLQSARQQIKPGSQEEPKLFDLRDQARSLLLQVEDVLTGEERGLEREKIAACRSLVERAVER
jgi:hypothetical protein